MVSMPRRDDAVSPNAVSPSVLKASMSVGFLPPWAMEGPSRSGPTRTWSAVTCSRESPPTPKEWVCTARTSVG